MKFVWIYLICMNIITFVVFKSDKNRAIKGRWRIPESTLLSLSILGGGFGGWAAMKFVRHKTKHLKFVLLVPLAALLQLALIWWLATS